MKERKNMILGIIIVIAVILLGIGIGYLFFKNTNNVLKNINTNEIFTYLDKDVNSELKDTYAFITRTNFDETVDILALKKDNTTIKIATTEYSDWKNGIYNLFYSDGKIYYNYGDDIIRSINLNGGNGNYNIVSYDFLEGDITDDNWFYVKNNKVYYLNSADLHICDLNTEECESQNLDIKQGFDIKIDNKKISTNYDKVYIDSNLNIYILSEDEENIYKIDIDKSYDDNGLVRATYNKVYELDKNSHLVSNNKKLTYKNVNFKFNSDDETMYIEKENKIYQYKEGNNYIPATLLSNNYLMVYDSADDSISSRAQFINLNKEEKNLLFDYNFYTDHIWFIENN